VHHNTARNLNMEQPKMSNCPIIRYTQRRKNKDPSFDTLSFFRHHYGSDTEGDKWFSLWLNNRATPISLRDYCEAQLSNDVLLELRDRRQGEGFW